jgi:hypothetical protein
MLRVPGDTERLSVVLPEILTAISRGPVDDSPNRPGAITWGWDVMAIICFMVTDGRRKVGCNYFLERK